MLCVAGRRLKLRLPGSIDKTENSYCPVQSALDAAVRTPLSSCHCPALESLVDIAEFLLGCELRVFLWVFKVLNTHSLNQIQV